jgi:hypothetical protein
MRKEASVELTPAGVARTSYHTIAEKLQTPSEPTFLSQAFTRNASFASNESQPTFMHFLFLLDDGLPHAEIWQNFFSSAPAGSYAVWAHCAKPRACLSKRSPIKSALPELKFVDTAYSKHCVDLVTPFVQLLKAALADGTSHPREKFVLIGDATLPVKPFSYVQATLSANDDSDFCFFPKRAWKRFLIDGRYFFLPKHHQWVNLNRAHAEKLVSNWDSSTKFWSRFRLKHAPRKQTTCTDEYATFESIFGPLPMGYARWKFPGLAGATIRSATGAAEWNQGSCRTYASWAPNDGHHWKDTMELSKQITDPRDKVLPPRGFHPVSLAAVGDRSLQILRNSPFLFVRKFTQHAHLQHFAEIMFSK